MAERFFESPKTQDFFKDIEGAASFAYASIFFKEKQVIGPESNYCFNVAYAMKLKLKGKYPEIAEIYAKIFPNRKTEFLEHKYLILPNFSKKHWLIDGQYLQFVPEEDRGNLPKVLIVPFNEQQELIWGLLDNKIPRQYHDFWLKIFRFDQKLGSSFAIIHD